jgi:hypothetical protein
MPPEYVSEQFIWQFPIHTITNEVLLVFIKDWYIRRV